MSDSLLLTSALDQSVSANDEWIIENVHKLVDKALQNKDADIIINACNQIFTIAQIGGKALVELLYQLWKHWLKFGIEEDFMDYIFIKTGKHRHTIERYLNIGIMLDHAVPEKFVEEIQKKPLEHLCRVANAHVQGYDFEDKDWQEIVEAPDASTVGHIVRRVRNDPPRPTLLQIWIDRSGDIYAQKGDNPQVFVGSLEVRSKDEIVIQAMNRIRNSAGIMEI